MGTHPPTTEPMIQATHLWRVPYIRLLFEMFVRLIEFSSNTRKSNSQKGRRGSVFHDPTNGQKPSQGLPVADAKAWQKKIVSSVDFEP